MVAEVTTEPIIPRGMGGVAVVTVWLIHERYVL